MTAPSTKDAPEPATVTKLAAPRHKWRDDGFRHRDSTPTNCDEHERVCELCGLVKITVHQPVGIPPRAWRTKGGIRFPHDGLTPTCDGAPT